MSKNELPNGWGPPRLQREGRLGPARAKFALLAQKEAFLKKSYFDLL
jgi:hypothetical protein